MEVSFTFRNVESSEAVKNYAKEKLTRLQKYVRSPCAPT
jgi:ribosome-associated translation inhibitor RaiA